MKILAIEKEIKGVRSDQFTEKILKEEAEQAWYYYQQGIFREMYFTKGTNLAVIIIECENILEANKILNQLPLVKNELIDFEINELLPYNGFDRLFQK
jgi:hypothetical protein